MIIPPRQFVAFMDGRLGDWITIAHLPGLFGAHINALTTEVRIQRAYARKMIDKHRLLHAHFEMIQVAVDRGWCRVDDRRRSLGFLLDDDVLHHTIFLLAIKTAAGGEELWLRTFHRSNAEQLRSHLRRGGILRNHDPEVFEE